MVLKRRPFLNEKELRERWFALWARTGARAHGVGVYAELMAHYAESHRAYHTIKHVSHCLYRFEQVIHLMKHPDEVAMALWFHDAVHDPEAKDNELKSAELATRLLNENYVSYRFARRVHDYILPTDHKKKPENPDAQLMVDIDACILGESELIFDEYDRVEIPREYVELAKVPEEIFRKRRVEILTLFLKRPSIYCTEYFRSIYEAQAARNLRRAIMKLKSPILG